MSGLNPEENTLRSFSEDLLADILGFVKSRRGIDFSSYRPSTINRRLTGRMQATGMPDFDSYARFLKSDPIETEELVNAFTIKVSHFFRNPLTFEVMRDLVLPELIETSKKELRIWSAGCAKGEEPYSLAILLRDLLEKEDFANDILVLATDIDRKALAEAEKAVYRGASLNEVKKGLLDRYFIRISDGLYMVNEEVRSMVNFAFHDLTTCNPPKEGIFSDYSIIFCRNVLIYFNVELQERVINSFSGHLQPSGYLVLGEAESMPSMLARSYREIMPRTKIFRKEAK